MKKYYLHLLILLALLGNEGKLLAQLPSTIEPEKAGFSEERLGRIRTYVEEKIKDGKLAGAVSMIMRKGHKALETTYGYADLETQEKMALDQVFYIQSMTKPIISVGIMMLYEEGHFFLTDPVSMYLPQFKEMRVAKDVTKGKNGETEAANKEITIAHLLSHTAGLSHGLGASLLDTNYAVSLYFKPHKNIEDRVNELPKLPLMGHPGEQWYYSASPDVLALLIEHFSGKNCADFIQERIFDPLGMVDTGYNLPTEKQDRMVALHAYGPDGKLMKAKRQTPMEGNTIYGGTHGLFSTASDYMKFCQMLLNGGEFNGKRLLGRKTIELMTQNHVGDLFNAVGHGFGLGFGVRTNIADAKIQGSLGQFFWGGAYNTYFFIDPKEELVGIFMMQVAPYTDFHNLKFRQFVYQAIID